MLPTSQALIINEWCLFAHPLFLDQFELLLIQVEKLRKKDPKYYKGKNTSKRLAAITKLVFEKIPQDPTLPEYRQGTTLGDEHKHWFRAKFFQQYRLFFRFHLESKVIVYAWVNDEDTKRVYDSKSDAYIVFKKMLKKGQPPSNWDDLLAEAKSASKQDIAKFMKNKSEHMFNMLQKNVSLMQHVVLARK
jgi:toxin YhaV